MINSLVPPLPRLDSLVPPLRDYERTLLLEAYASSKTDRGDWQAERRKYGYDSFYGGIDICAIKCYSK